jgi:hypothetical protein
MRVLGITPDCNFLRALRMEMPLLNLKKQGLIQDYVVTDSRLSGVPPDSKFDVVWLQRVEDYEFVARLRD